MKSILLLAIGFFVISGIEQVHVQIQDSNYTKSNRDSVRVQIKDTAKINPSLNPDSDSIMIDDKDPRK